MQGLPGRRPVLWCLGPAALSGVEIGPAVGGPSWVLTRSRPRAAVAIGRHIWPPGDVADVAPRRSPVSDSRRSSCVVNGTEEGPGVASWMTLVISLVPASGAFSK